MTALGLRSRARLGLGPRRRSRPTVAFAPDRIANLAFWYDATLSPTVASAGAIERLDDLSGNANHAAQTSTARRPLMTLDGASREVVRFDGVDDVLEVGAPPSFANGLSLFIVFRMRTRVSFRGILSASASSGADHQSFFTFQNSTDDSREFQLFGRSTQPDQTVAKSIDSTEVQYAIITFDSDGVDVELRDLNGIKGDMSTAAPFGTPAAFVLGARYNNGAPFSFGAIDLYEVGLYDRVLANGERDQLEGYLRARHGLSWTPMHVGADLAWYHDALDSGFIETGGLVDQWDDRSGAARHWVQTGTARPVRATDGGGRATVRFDGLDDAMQMAGTLPPLEPFSVALIYAVRNRGDFEGVLSAAPASGADHSEFWTFQNASAVSSQMQLFGRSSEPVAADQLLLSRPDGGDAQIAVWTVGGGSGELRDGAGAVSDAYGGSFGTPAEVVLGGRYNGAPFGYAEVDVMATVGIGRALSATDQQKLLDWATAKWSL